MDFNFLCEVYMFKRKLIARHIAMLFLLPTLAHANDSEEMERLRAEIQLLKQSYETRIQALEKRLEHTETVANKADEKAENVAIQSKPTTASNALNPNISLILSGTYANRSQDSDYHITNFQSGGEIGPGTRGFSLGESELAMSANVDDKFYGRLNLSLAEDNSVGVEEAFIQTTALPAALTVKAGRFFSDIGYLNSQHAHTWDFVDNPLAYQAFLGTQYGDDGVQVKWLAPTDLFLELGAEYGKGRIADTSGRDQNKGGAGSLFAHLGGDVGVSNSWRAGLSYLSVSPENRESNDVDTSGQYISNSFTGNSQLWIADFVWKWAPNGNAHDTSLKLQGEYLHRKESGDLTYNDTTTGRYSASQNGWYLQTVYKFLPYWRTGLRYDQLDSGNVDYGINTANLDANGYNPRRISWMVDYSPSEFSRLRLQLARDESRQNETDNQLFIQYQMSLGAHGAHQY
jgi:hypothetical protein